MTSPPAPCTCRSTACRGGGRVPAIVSSTNRTAGPVTRSTAMPLAESIERGLRERAIDAAKEMLQTVPPLEVVNNELIPALDRVGKGFEKGTVFLPQLLMSAEAAKAAFEVVKDAMKGEIRLAPFVTHTMGLDAINEAFELMHDGESIRTVIHF